MTCARDLFGILTALFLQFVPIVYSSAGDGSWFFQKCARICWQVNCSETSGMSIFKRSFSSRIFWIFCTRMVSLIRNRKVADSLRIDVWQGASFHANEILVHNP